MVFKTNMELKDFIIDMLVEKGPNTTWRFWYKDQIDLPCEYCRIVYVFKVDNESYLALVYDDDTADNYIYLDIKKFDDIILAWSASDQEGYNEMT